MPNNTTHNPIIKLINTPAFLWLRSLVNLAFIFTRRYLIVTGFNLASFLLLYHLEPAAGSQILLLLLILPVILSSWFFGTTYGAVSLTISLSYLAFREFSFTQTLEPAAYIRISLFAIIGLFVSYLSSIRQHYEAYLINRQKHFQKILDLSTVPLLLVDKDRHITFATQSIESILKLPAKKLLLQPLEKVLATPDRRKLNSFINQALRNPLQQPILEIRSFDKAKNLTWIELQARNLLFEPNINAVLLNVRDITDRKRFDHEMDKVLKSEKEARQIAEDAVRMRDEFLSIASHELKTPLTNILLQLQITLDRTLNQTLAEFSGANLVLSLQKAVSQSHRLSNLIKDLLNVSIASTGKLKLEFMEGDYTETLDNLLSSFEEQLKQNGSKLKFDHNGPIPGTFDPIRLEQAVTNLLTNAIKYSHNKPVHLSLSTQDEMVYIAVKDQGIGIPEDKQERIFERFRRGVDNNNYEGLGIGLFISKQIALAHGGDILLESVPKKGSTFTLTLPIHAVKHQVN
jgi:PAS domain S-box-containing protein